MLNLAAFFRRFHAVRRWTGFRIEWGGAHVRWGISPDLVCYGKLVGGGMPIGVLAGKRSIMRGFSEGGVMGVQGSHHGHPLAMAAGTAVLGWLKKNRGWFYQAMRARLGSLEQELNAYCESRC